MKLIVGQFHLYFTSSFRASRFTLIFLAHGMEKLHHKNGKNFKLKVMNEVELKYNIK